MTMINCGVALETLNDLGKQDGLPVCLTVGRERRQDDRIKTLDLAVMEDGEVMPYTLTLFVDGCWALTKRCS